MTRRVVDGNADVDPNEMLAAVVSRYDVGDLLACVGALLLLPENAERELRLDQLGRVAASLRPVKGRPKLSLPRLRTICNSEPLSMFASPEDPAENLFSESMTFFRGSHVVFPGITEDGVYTLGELCRAIFVIDGVLSRSEFGRRAYGLLMGAFLVSDAVASRAEVGRGLRPASEPGGKVVVPPSGRMNALKRAVTFSKDDIWRILEQNGVSGEALAPLIVDCGDLERGQFMDGTSGLAVRPIVRVGDDLIVAEPTSIIFAMRHGVVRLATELGASEELARAFCDSVWANVVQSLDFLGNEALPISLPERAEINCFREGFFNVDKDKVLYAALVTDDLRDYADPYGRWGTEGVADSLEERAREAERAAMALDAPVNEVLILFLIQSTGRWCVTGFGETVEPLRSPRLVMSAGELRVIAELEGGDQLLLWKYAKAGDAVRQATRIMTFSQLDEFSLYRAKGYSYQIADEGNPTMVSISPGTGAELRFERQRKRDWHAVQSFEDGKLAEVTLLHDDPRVPIYVSPAYFGRVVALYVSGFGMPVWVVANGEGGESPEVRRSQTVLCEMIAFWLWQFSTEITEAPALRSLGSPLVVQVSLRDSEGWASDDLDDGRPGDIDAQLSCGVRSDRLAVDLELRPGLRHILGGPDNAGEREFMRRVLRGVRDLVVAVVGEGDGRLTEASIQSVLDRRAPLGPKKMTITYDLRSDPRLDPQDLPARRLVKDADVSGLREEIGAEMAARGFLPGQVLPGDVAARNVVEFLYRELEKLARSVRRDELLAELIAMNEALVQHAANLNLTIATRVACYGEFLDIVSEVMKEQTRVNGAMVASRFAIEYASAAPGDGARPMSLSVYDRLMALGDNIISWAFIGDLTHFGIADMTARVTESGRLALDTAGYEEARGAFLSRSFFPRQVKEAVERFGQRWRERVAGDEKPPWVQDLEAATAAEFGLPLSDMLTVLVEMQNIGYSQSGPTKVFPLQEVVTRLVERLAWPEEKTRRALEMLWLEPRSTFLDPSAPYRREDVYPWRFNRELSYARRPLILRSRGNGWEVVWGNRHLYLAGQNLLSLCLSGRLKARSPEMKTYLARSLNVMGHEFNDQVADLFEGRPDTVVRRRVKRVKGELIGGAATFLGDVDVLVGDKKRRELLAIECKDLALARTPRELANELEALFEGVEGRESTAERQSKRARWLRSRLKAVLEELGLAHEGSWKVKPMIVVDDEPLSSWIRRSQLPVLSFRALREQVQADD